MDLILTGMVDNEEVRHELLDGRYVIGRGDDADIKLVVPSISRRHAELTVANGGVSVRDLGSHNGTRLNGAQIGEPTVVQVGDSLGLANLVLRIEGPSGGGMTMYSASPTAVPNEEIAWEEIRTERRAKRSRQSQLFRVLAEAGDLLTIPREPEEMYEPILDLVETALDPERIFVLLLEEGAPEPVVKASRVQGSRPGDGLALSRTMVNRVLQQKTSFLTSDPVNELGVDGAMSMVAQSIRSAIAAPLFDNEEVIGLLYADDSRYGKRLSGDELRAFTMLANVVAVAITHSRYHVLEEEKRRQDAQLRTASDILDHILPSSLPVPDGYEVSASIDPCFEVGGDLYDSQALQDGRHSFLMGDVVGKGMGAALLVTHLLSLARFMTSERWQPAELMTRLNEQIFQCTDSVRFATAFLGYLEPASGRVTHVNAGHNPPFVIRNDGSVETIVAKGLPVGVLDDSSYKEGEVTLQEGDLLVMYSDGVPETQNTEDDEYGEDRFEQLLVRLRTEPLPEIMAALQQELAEFRGEAPVGDDVTLLLIRRSRT